MIPVIDKRETGINLQKIMDKYGITAKDIQEYLGLGCVQSVYRWLDGVNMPTIDNLYALSEFFQLPIDAIVCGNKRQITSDILIKMNEEQTRRLYIYYHRINNNLVA